MGNKRASKILVLDQVEQIAEPLHPRNRAQRRGLLELCGVRRYGEIREH